MEPGFGELPPFMTYAFVVFGIFFVGVLTLVVVGTVRRSRVLRENGLDPLAADAQIAARLARGPLGTPARTLEQRLAELDDLHRRGLISAEEHAQGRRAALTEPA